MQDEEAVEERLQDGLVVRELEALDLFALEAEPILARLIVYDAVVARRVEAILPRGTAVDAVDASLEPHTASRHPEL